MAEKLMHLPTKQTRISPSKGEPFTRRQHINPDKDVHKSERTGGKVQEAKQRLQPLHKQIDQPLSPKQQELAGGTVKHTDEFHGSVEKGFFDRVPDQVRPSNLELIDGDNANAVYIVNKGSDGEGFYKPRTGEDHMLRHGLINDNFAGREVLGYELSKMLGADGLVPPTKMWNPEAQVATDQNMEGSIQMSAHRFGERMGVTNIEKAFVKAGTFEGYKSQMDNIENAGDMMTWDFIISNTDRHGFNFFVGDSGEGKMKAIAYDHGVAFPEDSADKLHVEGLTTETMRAIARSGQASTPISTKFMLGILQFNEGDFDHLRKAYGLSDVAAQGVVNRVKSLQDHTKEKFAQAQKEWKPEDFKNMEEYNSFMRKKGVLTAYDVAQVAEKKYNVKVA